jgi:uncharacterized protein
MNNEAQQIITRLRLKTLPNEGGYFRRTWTGTACSKGNPRPIGTAIIFLITREEFSALHRLETDEVWHFYAGDPVELVQLDAANQNMRKDILGGDTLAGQISQIVVSGGAWQGARLAAEKQGWALLGCTMSPGWDQREFTLGDREFLLELFPNTAPEIHGLTR